MAQSINLIPQEERKEQRKERIVKFSSVLSVGLLVVVFGISGYFFYKTTSLKNQIEEANARIEGSRQDVNRLSEMEVTARELDSKYRILSELFTTRRSYSTLLQEVRKRIPDTVGINTFNISGDNNSTINLSGEGANYIAIARFIDTLSDNNFANAGEGYENLFTNVTLNSVTLDSQNLNVSYFLITNFDYTLLTQQ